MKDLILKIKTKKDKTYLQPNTENNFQLISRNELFLNNLNLVQSQIEELQTDVVEVSYFFFFNFYKMHTFHMMFVLFKQSTKNILKSISPKNRKKFTFQMTGTDNQNKTDNSQSQLFKQNTNPLAIKDSNDKQNIAKNVSSNDNKNQIQQSQFTIPDESSRQSSVSNACEFSMTFSFCFLLKFVSIFVFLFV